MTVTRAFGDFRISCMSAEPEVNSIELTGNESFLVLSSDGLTDVYSPEEIGRYIHDRKSPIVSQDKATGTDEGVVIPVGLSDILTQESVDDKGSMDNVSCIIVAL